MFLQKEIDFTKPGGFPFTQDTLNYMQEATGEALKALISVGGSTTGPMLLNGIVGSSAPSGGDTAYTFTSGWFIYNAKLVKFTGGTVTVSSGQYPSVTIANGATPLTFNDGSTPNVLLSTTATLTVTTGTEAYTSTYFPILGMKPYGRERDWTTVTSFTSTVGGSVTGTMSYKKCSLTNTLAIKGALTIDCSALLTAMPASERTKFYTVPTDYRGASDVWFSGFVPRGSHVKTSDSVQWIRELTIQYEASTGYLSVEVLKTLSDAPIDIEFNTVINLD